MNDIYRVYWFKIIIKGCGVKILKDRIKLINRMYYLYNCKIKKYVIGFVFV